MTYNLFPVSLQLLFKKIQGVRYYNTLTTCPNATSTVECMHPRVYIAIESTYNLYLHGTHMTDHY